MSRAGLLVGVLGAIELGVIVLDKERRVVLWNQWMARHSGVPSASMQGADLFARFPELRGQRVEAAVHSALHDNFSSLLSQTLNRAPFALYRTGVADGERMQQAVAVAPIMVEDGRRHCLIQIDDVSAAVGREKLLREQAEVLRVQSQVDGLTGIANRRQFDLALNTEVRRAQRHGHPLSLLMMDIDAFKAYNDYFGHQQGDACLMLVAEAFSALLQRPGDLAARYGGEEFSAILPEINAVQALHQAEAIRTRIAAMAIAHAPAALRPSVTVSIGVATYCSERMDGMAALLGAADRALYAAKRGGRDQVVLDQ